MNGEGCTGFYVRFAEFIIESLISKVGCKILEKILTTQEGWIKIHVKCE